jgi:hypothetical protein
VSSDSKGMILEAREINMEKYRERQRQLVNVEKNGGQAKCTLVCIKFKAFDLQ